MKEDSNVILALFTLEFQFFQLSLYFILYYFFVLIKLNYFINLLFNC